MGSPRHEVVQSHETELGQSRMHEYVSRELIHRQLQGILEAPLRIACIDVAHASFWRFRQAGHSVELRQPLDTSTVAPTAFDVACSHGSFADISESPELYIKSLVRLVRSEGYVSLVAKGYGGARAGLMAASRYDDTQRLAQSQLVAETLVEKPTRAFLPEEITTYLQVAGARILNWYSLGVTSQYDKRSVMAVDPESREAMIEQEAELSAREDTRGMGALLHFIAQVV